MGKNLQKVQDQLDGTYKGKTYKFTGAFAPINQITGLISF